jgi:hypothetical protein
MSHECPSIFGKSVVGITVQPALAGLGRGYDRMPSCMRMFAGVTVWRAVTAESNATRLTSAQVDPFIANLHALHAFATLRLFNRCDCVEMRAASVRHRSKSCCCAFSIRLQRTEIVEATLLTVFRKSRSAWQCRGVSASPGSRRCRLIAIVSRLHCQQRPVW